MSAWSGAAVRAHLVRRAFAAPTAAGPAGIAEAVARMGFVQLDPIRAPARAQDLILRHRVDGYRAGDLERAYPSLALDEDVVYAYGVVPPETRRMLHPREGGPEPAGVAAAVLAAVRERGPTHPRELLAAFGAARERNAWGGHSRATTRALEHLHYWGLLRVARREAGVRVYEAVPPAPRASVRSRRAAGEPVGADERVRRLTMLIARLFGPLPEVSLRGLVSMSRHAVPAASERAGAVAALVAVGALERGAVDGVAYVWPAGWLPDDGAPPADDAAPRVRFLAPFDPLVWDRRRVEQLWGWAYRFEAYTPAARRQYGYYALPMLWGDALVGWVNASTAGGALAVEAGFTGRRPKGRDFGRAFDAEVARMEEFLRPPEADAGAARRGSAARLR